MSTDTNVRPNVWPYAIGVCALVAWCFLVLMLTGCVAGYGEPGPDGSRPVILGAKVSDIAALGGRIGSTVAQWVGSPEGLLSLVGGTTGFGAIIALARGLFKSSNAAAAEKAASQAHDDAWDEATARAHGTIAAFAAGKAMAAPVVVASVDGDRDADGDGTGVVVVSPKPPPIPPAAAWSSTSGGGGSVVITNVPPTVVGGGAA